MASGSYHFEHFALDPGERQLRRDTVPVELNARYFDALALLVREQGKLVSKERFLEEVWRGVPVTDEALTQCVKMIRRQLGDSAASPRFIETVPKHGYRFIAPVVWVDAVIVAEVAMPASMVLPAPAIPTLTVPGLTIPAPATPTPYSWRQFFLLGGAGTAGGGVAGVLGGLCFAFAGVSQPLQSGVGAVSALLVIVCLTVLMALIGSAGVAFGIAAAGFAAGRAWQWSIVGGAAGGMVVGAVVKLLGLDAFNLLLGQAPGDITGAAEGTLLGGAVGFGIWLASRGTNSPSLGRSITIAALAGAGVGILIPLLGGRLMGGSLDLLARSFPNSRLRLDQIGSLFGENDFGPISQMVTGAFEGALFCGCIAGALLVARRSSMVNA